jgi:hypothetical protein
MARRGAVSAAWEGSAARARRRVVASFMGWGNVKREGVFRWG